MQDDVERVAQLLMDMDGDGRGYEDMARAAMAATRGIDAEALEPLAWRPNDNGGFDAYWAGRLPTGCNNARTM